MTIMWQKPGKFPTLNFHEVHVWKIDLKSNILFANKASDLVRIDPLSDIAELQKLLAPNEMTRLHRAGIAKVKNNFLLSRGILRLLLSKYTKQQPQDIILKENQFGKIFLQKPNNLYFNVSHAKDLILFAFTLEKQIGVDVEFMRETINIDEIATRFFAPLEIQALKKVTPQNIKNTAFFNCWARKEAFIKAIGQGLSYDLKRFSVDVSDVEAKRININIDDPQFTQQDWYLFAFQPKDNYAGALAIETSPNKIFFWEPAIELLSL